MIGGALIGAARGARVAASVAGHAAFTASRGVFKIALHVIEGVATRNTPTKKTKFKWDHVLHRYGEGRARALRIAGAEVRRGTQRSMSLRTPLKTPRLVDLGVVNGERLVAKRTQIPKADRVTSWRTVTFPKGFLRSDIQYDYDPATDTVVVGPTRLPRLNRLHEIGGSINLFFVRTGPPVRVPRRFRGGTVFGIQANRPIGKDAISLGTRRVKARRFMARGLEVSRDKIAPAWRDKIVGP